ncbi:MAG: VOC family protein [bacterium JZ-2024 1]
MGLVAFYFVGDMQRAQKIYSALLKREPVRTSNEWTEYHLGDARFALHIWDHLPETFETVTVKNGAILSFEVQDIQESVCRARDLGFHITQSPCEQPFGWLATLQDPWGNILQLHQPHNS